MRQVLSSASPYYNIQHLANAPMGMERMPLMRFPLFHLP